MAKPSQTSIPAWVSGELEKAQEESEDFADLLTIADGATATFTIDLNPKREAREATTQFGVRSVLPIIMEGAEMGFMLNRANPIYREILAAVSEGKRTFMVKRTGLNLKTRYEVVKAE